jgi:hypothetical protein
VADEQPALLQWSAQSGMSGRLTSGHYAKTVLSRIAEALAERSKHRKDAR